MKVIQLLVLFLAISSFAAIKGSSKRYDINFVDADFQSVFHSISQLAGVDILLAPDVQGRLSMTVTQKTWPEMMDIVCNLYDLTWLVESNYISVQKTASYQQKVIRESEKREQSDMVAPLARRSFQIRHASAAEMAKVLETIKSARGKISVIERNNAIIVYDTERRLQQMQSTLNELDIETLQIVITAKLVVVDSRLANDLGVDWSNMTVGGPNSRVQANFSNQPSMAGITSADGTGGGAMASTVTPATQLSVSAFNRNVQATIANILSDSRSEILASPQISTLDHTEANIFMGDQISIRVIDNSGQSSTQMVESGIKLTVTPHVAGDNRILLELHPENNSYSYDDKGQVVISKQEAKTKVVVSDGETVVIGGLTKNDEIEAETGIPFLKDIPVLGYLFKHTRKEINKKDLVIFVTPRIMRNYLSDAPVAMAAKAKSVPAPAPAPVPAASSVEEEPEDEEADDDDGWE
jgi:type IV pilus secretin PilQ/predicted competence protein